MNSPMILEACQLRKEYGSKAGRAIALAGVDLQVQPGAFIAIMGPSGSGKTTLLNLLSTIDRPTSGKVSIDGHDLSRLSRRQMARLRHDRIGFVFQNYSLLDSMRIEDNIALPLTLDRVPARQIRTRVRKLASQFGLSEQLKKYPYQLSGGQKQRAAAARALITHPAIVFADEPTGALDSRSGRQLMELLRQMNQQEGATIVLVTHDALCASYASEVYLLKDGKFVSRLGSGGDQKEFYDRIVDAQSALGGSLV